MACIILKQRGLETCSFPMTDGRITIGRSSKNNIVVNNRYASGHHCEIICENGDCTVFDLNSTNGLFVNGIKITSKKLEDGDRILIGAAILIFIANEEAVELESLIARLQKRSADERELAANLLGQLGTTAETGPLIEALNNDPVSKVKAAAAEALGLLGDSQVVKVLLPYFDTADILLRNSVIRAIIRIADDEAIDGIAGFLKHEDRKLRVLAAYTLGQTHNARATKYLKKALGDEAFAVREAVVKALGDLEDPKALSVLLDITKDPQRFPQVWVIESLGKIRNAEAVPTIIRALKNPSPEVREAAADALGKFRIKEVMTPLMAALDDNDAMVRKAAAKSLEKLRRYIMVEKTLSSSSRDTRKTMEIYNIDESEARGSARSPLFGEDRAQWQKWWSEYSAK